MLSDHNYEVLFFGIMFDSFVFAFRTFENWLVAKPEILHIDFVILCPLLLVIVVEK